MLLVPSQRQLFMHLLVLCAVWTNAHALCFHDAEVNVPMYGSRGARLTPLLLLCRQGKALERFAQMTNWNYYEAARRFQKVRGSLQRSELQIPWCHGGSPLLPGWTACIWA